MKDDTAPAPRSSGREARDTGPQNHIAVPLARAHEIFRDVCEDVAGLPRTAVS